MNIGYARVSTIEQNLNFQEDALMKMNCESIFTDKISGRTENREGFNLAVSHARRGDNLVVFSLSRLSRSLRQLIEVAAELESKGIGLISITEQIDTSSPNGRLVFHLMASLSQFEADLIRQRTICGLQAARSRGTLGGRPLKITGEKLNLLQELMNKESFNVKEISELFGVSRATVHRCMFKINNAMKST